MALLRARGGGDFESLDAINRWIGLGWVERLDVAVSAPRPAGMMLYGLEYGKFRNALIGSNPGLPPPAERWFRKELGRDTDEAARTEAWRSIHGSGVSLREIVERARHETMERIEATEDEELSGGP
ncbi:hypothetical protein [Ornithinimicrobium avium]|uniref:Uncharacterized protein n=1 Tax=Ornithinimicrobium avium TaxID=2283195 RepID=A0A345NKE0_9MICO|nr:hypothetical protein [Ornithinimicrobium avium]AXH95498.1 hypothetical protein DV701_04560 [Ornithinimicrobium avium]